MLKKLDATIKCDMFEAVDLSKDIPWTIVEINNEEESNDVEEEAEPKVEIPKVLSFCESMKRLSPHRLSLKEWMKDRTIRYVDLFRPDLLPARLEENCVQQVRRKLESWRMKSNDDRATSDE